MSRQKGLDANPKEIQQIKLVGQLKRIDSNGNATDVGNDQSTKIFWRKCNSFIKDGELWRSKN